ncbi:MAG: hypothetical protein QM767_23800 [Anaeromyxobacter sp.]
MKRVLMVSTLGALVACGGGDGGVKFKDPDSVTFTYGTPQAPTLTEQDEAAAAGQYAGAAVTLQDEQDDAVATEESMDLANLPNELADLFPGPAVVGLRSMQDRPELARAAAVLSSKVESMPVWDNPDCWQVTATASEAGVTGAISFDGCTITEVDGTATMTMVLDGSFNRIPGRRFWDASVHVNMSEPTENGTARFSVSEHLSGDVSITETTIQGFARSDVAAQVSVPGASDSLAVTYNADLDLVYEVPFCVVDGSLIAKRIWTTRPTSGDFTAEELADAAVRFDWLGCGNVQVSWGTLP